jgi:lysophospholipase L1-like esterase
VRFLQDGPAELTVSAPVGEVQREDGTWDRDVPGAGAVDVSVFRGPFDAQIRETVAGDPTTVSVPAAGDPLTELDPAVAADRRYDPAVTRVLFRGSPVRLHDVTGDVRPPDPAGLPEETLLTYGTSITQGGAATREHLTYARQTARHLGADLLNLGTAGSAYCERAIAEHVADRDDWDRAVLALSVNMVDVFSVETFRERARTLVETVAGTGRPVTCVTLYPYFDDLAPDWTDEGPSDAFRAALREIAADAPANVDLVEGPDVLRTVGGLTTDLIHPGDDGMVDMGRALAAELDET